MRSGKTQFTISQLEKLKADGKIKDFKIMGPADLKPMVSNDGRIVSRHYAKASPEKDYISRHLLEWTQNHLVKLLEEFKFHPDRKWRFDWCIPDLKIAIEFEGGIFKATQGHNSIKGMLKDIQKYNAAQELGWKVIRMHPKNYQTVISEIEKLLS